MARAEVTVTLADLPQVTAALTAADEQITWYRRRCAALEALLAGYRTGRPQLSEKLHHELETTRLYVGPQGEWLGASTVDRGNE